MSSTPLDDLGPPQDPLIGSVVGERYRLLRRIGSGGMGAVYEGLHTVIGRKVAVKLLHPQLAGDPEQAQRFLNEARAAGTLGHPHIVDALDMGRTPQGAPYLVLELLEGETLSQRISRTGPLSPSAAVEVARQAASALSAAHARLIVHRDLKPDNLFLARLGDGTESVKVLDFGISKFAEGAPGQATRTGSVMGTPAYMAPEQLADSSKVDPRADVYALGVVLYQALSGRLPFEADTFPRLMQKIEHEEAPALLSLRPELPASLAELVHTCLQKEPARRFQSMEALRSALDSLGALPSSPGTAAPGTGPTFISAAPTGLAATLPTPVNRPITAPAPQPAPTAAPPPQPQPAPTVAAPDEARRQKRKKLWRILAIATAIWFSVPSLRHLILPRRPPRPGQPAHAVGPADEDPADDEDEDPDPLDASELRLPCPASMSEACKGRGSSGKLLEPWCDGSDKLVACCGEGLVAQGEDGVCGCPPGGADPGAPVAGCPTSQVAIADYLKAGLAPLQPKLVACGKGNKQLSGGLEISFDLTSEGVVDKVRVDASEVTDAAVQSCVLHVVRRAKLGPPPGGARHVRIPVLVNR